MVEINWSKYEMAISSMAVARRAFPFIAISSREVYGVKPAKGSSAVLEDPQR